MRRFSSSFNLSFEAKGKDEAGFSTEEESQTHERTLEREDSWKSSNGNNSPYQQLRRRLSSSLERKSKGISLGEDESPKNFMTSSSTTTTATMRRESSRGSWYFFPTLGFNEVVDNDSSSQVEASKREGDERWNENMEKLSQVISCKEARQSLINELLDVKSDFIEKIRFCGCVLEFHACESQSKKNDMGKKIVSLFVDPGSRFRLKTLDAKTREKLVGGHLEYLELARRSVMHTLCSTSEVVVAVHIVKQTNDVV